MVQSKQLASPSGTDDLTNRMRKQGTTLAIIDYEALAACFCRRLKLEHKLATIEDYSQKSQVESKHLAYLGIYLLEVPSKRKSNMDKTALISDRPPKSPLPQIHHEPSIQAQATDHAAKAKKQIQDMTAFLAASATSSLHTPDAVVGSDGGQRRSMAHVSNVPNSTRPFPSAWRSMVSSDQDRFEAIVLELCLAKSASIARLDVCGR